MKGPIMNTTHHFLELSTFVSPYLRKNGVRDRSCTYTIDTPCDQHRLLLFSKLLAQPSFHYFFGQLWLQNFKQLFLTHFCTDSLDCLSKCVLIIITEVPVSLSKQYY